MKFIRFILITAAIGMLAAGAAACGKSSTKSAGAAQPSPTVSPAPRATSCQKIAEAGYKLWEPAMAIDAAGTDSAKLKDALQKLNAAMDGFNAELSKVSETADSELKPVIGGLVADMQRMQKDLAAAGTDAAKVKAILDAETNDTEEDQFNKLCAG